jgi:glycosyltransferase involved in cell wall biosynthesis
MAPSSRRRADAREEVSRVLFVCPEPLGHRNPAGVGIRFIELSRAVRGEGHEVEILSPEGGAIEGCAAGPLTPESLAAGTARADLAIVQGHAANDLLAHGRGDIPIVVDLYDPYPVENFHYFASRGAEVFEHDHPTILRSLRRGDFFLCASEAQRFFYLGMLLATGRVNPALYARDAAMESLLATIPFGVPPWEPPQRAGFDSREIFFGAIYDWYDPALAVEAVEHARRSDPRLSITFTFHPNAATTPQSLFSRLRADVARSGRSSFVKFEPWVAYEERRPFYDRFALALLTFHPSLETDLAMRTRMFDCFWGSLPVISSSAGGTDPLIARYGSGAVVPSSTPEDYAAAILDLLSDGERYARAREGCRRFTEEHQWDQLAKPLLEFCRAPRRDDTSARFAIEQPVADVGPPRLLDRLRRKVHRLRRAEGNDR